jgi:hypothetical protein
MMVIWIAVLALLASACAGHPATSPGGPAPGVLANASPAGSAGGAGPAVSGSAPPTFAPVVAGSRRVLGSRRPAAGATGDPTFDVGWQDWVSTVLPMLQARGMVAEFDLTLTAIGDGNITWPEVEASGRGRQWNRRP